MNVKICEIVQQEKYLKEEKIKEVVKRKCIKKYAYILHNSDRNEKGDLKEAHWHIMLQFADTQHTEYIAKWFGIKEQFVKTATSKSKTQGKKYDDMLCYLIHKNDPNKYQYSPNLVKASFDYNEFILGGGKTTRLAEILKAIDEGIIREFNYTNYISNVEYDKYKKHIENAYQYRRDKLYTGDRNLEVVFVTGNSGCGKTSFAKWLSKSKGMSFHVSGSGEDFLDGYKGQDCLILDDIRSSSMKFSEFIKLCDNHTDSNVKSRYHNKYLTECKLLIITSIFDIDKFYNGVFAESDEPVIQFKRRCTMYLKMDKYIIDVYQFDKHIGDYKLTTQFKNPVKNLISDKSSIKTESELSSYFCLTPIVHIKGLNLEKKVKSPFE